MVTQLTPLQVSQLLDELCVKLGFCLPPTEQRRLEREPPTDVDAFTDAIFAAEGMAPRTDRHLRRQVRDRVISHFGKATGEGAA